MADLDAFLARVALDRCRLVAPVVIFGITSSLLMSEPNGVPIPLSVMWLNLALVTALAAVTGALWARWIPARFGHAIGLALFWVPISTTLASYGANHNHMLVLALMLEMSGMMLIISTRALVVSLALLDAIWIALRASVGGADAAPEIELVLGAQLVGLVGQIILRRHLVASEQHRLAEVAAARELAEQLAERERLQEQLLHAQRMEAVGTLAAGVAHDMNNVLASIMGLSEGLMDETSVIGQRQELERIVGEAQRGAELTHGLLAFSRRGKYRKQQMRVATVVEDVVPILARTLPKTVHLRDSNDAADTRIEGDATQLSQALINLGLNAADAMRGQGTLEIAADAIELTAATHGLPPGRYARLRVTDTGTGIDDVTRKRIFEPFFTTKPRGKGTGLGLSIVYGIVKNHGGAIVVDSELGRGTTFTLYLPSVDGAEVTQRERPTATVAAERRPGTVLVIDDEPGVRRAHARTLARLGHRVLLAQDGEVGLRMFDANADAIALVILDMGMPVMGGAECFRRLRERTGIPVLIATGYADVDELSALVEQGAAVLEKPFPASRLAEEVTRLLDTVASATA
jgi:signal transduction histidine kinase/CheY-like chemotaxis protein